MAIGQFGAYYLPTMCSCTLTCAKYYIFMRDRTCFTYSSVRLTYLIFFKLRNRASSIRPSALSTPLRPSSAACSILHFNQLSSTTGSAVTRTSLGPSRCGIYFQDLDRRSGRGPWVVLTFFKGWDGEPGFFSGCRQFYGGDWGLF